MVYLKFHSLEEMFAAGDWSDAIVDNESALNNPLKHLDRGPIAQERQELADENFSPRRKVLEPT